MSNWDALKNKKIIDFFIGEKVIISALPSGDLKLPRMRYQEIYAFGKKLGMNIYYTNQKPHPWQYMYQVLEYAIDNSKMNQFFKELLSKQRFDYLADLDFWGNDPQSLYIELIYGLFERINEYLQFQDLWISCDFKHNKYSIRKTTTISKEKRVKNDTTQNFSAVITNFCNKIKKEGFSTKYGVITNIKDSGTQGGNGKVIFGKLNDKDIAIKILISEDKKKKNRFFEEFLNVLMSLEKTRGIVELYLFDSVKFEGKEIQYIVMKKYEKNLSKEKIETQENLIKFALEFAKIIDSVHEKGIIHRDIKPENIMLDNDNSIILTDFGIAYYDPNEFENTGHTVSKELLGNRGFSAPEQLIKGTTPKVTMDIYSYGQILQFMVTGRPHTGTDKVNIGRYISGDKINIIDKVIIKCLRFEPEKRYQSMKDIIKELLSLIDYNKNYDSKSEIKKTNNIDANVIYEFICINDVVSTKELAKEFNYDIFNLKKELIRLFKVNRLIKPLSLSDIPEDDECNWTRYY